MKLEIVAPLGKIYEGEVKEITLPGSDGEFGVLEGHTPLVTTLKTGVVDIKKESGDELVAINWGYVEVTPESVNLIVDDAVALSSSESDIAIAVEKAKKLVADFSESNHALAYTEGKIESVARNFN